MDEHSVEILKPGQLIRPRIGEETAIALLEKLYPMKVLSIKELNSYDDRNFFVTVAPEDDCAATWPHGYVLKIQNSLDSQKNHVAKILMNITGVNVDNLIAAEHEVIKVLSNHGINCPRPTVNVRGEDKSLEYISYANDDNEHTDGGYHIVRLLTFIPGQLFAETSYSAQLFFSVGRSLGAFDKALEGFQNSELEHHQTIWNLSNVPKLREFLYVINDVEHRTMVEEVIQAMEDEVLQKSDQFKKGIIHGDYNEQNIIVTRPKPTGTDSAEEEFEISGIIDFGDMNYSCYIFEIAIAIMYMMLESKTVDILDVGGHVLAGYLSQRRVTEAEFDAIRTCVAARYAQSLVLGAYSHSLDPSNEYLLTTSRNGWTQLKILWKTSKIDLYGRWRNVMKNYDIVS